MKESAHILRARYSDLADAPESEVLTRLTDLARDIATLELGIAAEHSAPGASFEAQLAAFRAALAVFDDAAMRRLGEPERRFVREARGSLARFLLAGGK